MIRALIAFLIGWLLLVAGFAWAYGHIALVIGGALMCGAALGVHFDGRDRS